MTLETAFLSGEAPPEPSEAWRYHPATIEATYRHQTLKVWGRCWQILFPLGMFFFGLWWDRRRRKPPQRQRAIQLRDVLTRLGPTYIKIGQALSTRPDLVPPVFLEELAKLQDQLPSFPNEVAFQFIEEELGHRPEAIFAELSPRPLAAASLGQVYRGRLKSGEWVAVKVQRPDLQEQIALDIHILRSLAHWLEQKSQGKVRSDLVGITDEFAARIFEEMNYSQEGKNAEKFAQLYGGMREIYVPRIYWEYTGRRVLTMEWIQGTKLTQIQEVAAQGIDATKLVEVGVECSLRQLLEHGFFHADPHPGNLLAMADGRLAYLDFGMMSTIKPYQRYGLIEAIVHLVNRDFDALAQDYVSLEFLTPDTDLRPIVPALNEVFGNALGASVAEMNFKSITDQMSAMMYEFPFRVPAYYALIIRSMVTLEGIAIGIDPEFKVLSKAYPYVAKRLLTDPSEELRNSLRDLLFKEGKFRWNRLENLLRNAQNSPDYNLTEAVDQAIAFIFSERGNFIRERLAEEIIQAVDMMGQRTLNQMAQQWGQGWSLPVGGEVPNETWQHIRNIWQILAETPGFDGMKLLPLVPELLRKPETQALGQRIAEGLLQRIAVRVIRNLLLSNAPEAANRLPQAALR